MADPTRAELLVAVILDLIHPDDLSERADEVRRIAGSNERVTRHIEEARALLGSEWKPIATAPKGEIILLWAVTSVNPPNWKMATGYQANNGDWQWDGEWLKPYQVKPTHWQPLPDPPSSEPNNG